MEKRATGPKGQIDFLFEVGHKPVQKLSRPMPAGKDKPRGDRKRTAGPKGQIDFLFEAGKKQIQKTFCL